MQELWLQHAGAQNASEGTTRGQIVCGEGQVVTSRGPAGPQPQGCVVVRSAAVQTMRART